MPSRSGSRSRTSRSAAPASGTRRPRPRSACASRRPTTHPSSRAAVEARVGDLEAAHDPVPLLVAGPRTRDRAAAQSVRAAPRRGRLVRRRPRPRPRRDAHVPRRAHPLATSASRRGASATSGCRRSSTSRPIASRGRGRSATQVGMARIEVQGDTAWWVHRTLADAGTSTTASSRRPTRRSGRSSPGSSGRTAAPSRSTRRSSATRCATRLHLLRDGTRARRPSPPASGGAERASAGRATAGRPGRARALRRPPGAARTPPRRVRRRARHGARRRRARRAVLDPARGAPGDALAPQPRELRRRVLHGLRRGRRGDGRRPRRQGALRRRLPQGAEADPARGARDPARDRVRRPDDRGRRPHAARTRAPEARGDLRPVRARASRRRRARRRRGGARPHARGRRGEAPARGARVPQGRRGGADDAPRRAVHDRAGAPVLARPHVGSHGRRAAHLPARPDALGEAHARALRAARGLRPELPLRAGRRACSGMRRRSRAGSSSAAHAR